MYSLMVNSISKYFLTGLFKENFNVSIFANHSQEADRKQTPQEHSILLFKTKVDWK